MNSNRNAEESTAEKLDSIDDDVIENLGPICRLNCPCPRCHVRRREERAAQAKKTRKARLHRFKRKALREQRAEERRLREDAEVAKSAWERGEPPVFHGDEYIGY